jgi:hypothetical protein
MNELRETESRTGRFGSGQGGGSCAVMVRSTTFALGRLARIAYSGAGGHVG